MARWRLWTALGLVFAAGLLARPRVPFSWFIDNAAIAVASAIALLAGISLWRAIVPRGSSRGPLLLLLLAAALAGRDAIAGSRVVDALIPAALIILAAAIAGAP